MVWALADQTGAQYSAVKDMRVSVAVRKVLTQAPNDVSVSFRMRFSRALTSLMHLCGCYLKVRIQSKYLKVFGITDIFNFHTADCHIHLCICCVIVKMVGADGCFVGVWAELPFV